MMQDLKIVRRDLKKQILKTLQNSGNKILILGVGNLLMNDEGVGIQVIQRLEKNGFTGADLMDGGTGGFHLLGFIQSYQHVIFVDASADQYPPGTVRVLHPHFAKDFPQQLSAHEIGLKDLIESCSLSENVPEFHLIAISVSNYQDLGLALSQEAEAAIPVVIDHLKELVASLQ